MGWFDRRMVTHMGRVGLLVSLFAVASSAAHAQTAPYVLPYTMSTYAGPHAPYTSTNAPVIGSPCGSAISLDSAGDGCLASTPFTATVSTGSAVLINVVSNAPLSPNQIVSGAGIPPNTTIVSVSGNTVTLSAVPTVSGSNVLLTSSFISVGVDPHDLRVDGMGNVYFEDNTASAGVVHKINPYTTLTTIAVGSLVNSKVCGSSPDKYGTNCVASDGAANATSNYYTTALRASRGLAVANNGDLLIAGYNLYMDDRVSVSTGVLASVAGNGTASPAGAPVDGPIAQSQVGQARGIGVDANNNAYIADSSNNVVRKSSNGVVSTVTKLNAGNNKDISSGIPIGQAQVSAPEDVQVDTFGNVWIGDFGNAVVRVVYYGGTIPNVTNPVVGNVYTVAGFNALAGGTATPYPTDGSSPTFPATSITISDRKISLDSLNNLYIADQTRNIVWFVDHATGYIRLLAGNYGLTTPLGCPAMTNNVGDGCPGPFASFNDVSSNSGFGTSPDNQGNLYITDPEGTSQAAASRVRKLLSGLDFPAMTIGASVTQTVELHFAPNDTPAATNAYTVTGTGSDFVLGTPACNTQTDTTTDCTLPITFTPSVSGYDTATLSVVSAQGGKANFLLIGSGTAPALAFDPGNTSVVNSNVRGPQGVVLDGAGNSYIADTGNNRVLFTNAQTGQTTVFAGGAAEVCAKASNGVGDGCPATQASLNGPRAVAIDTAGNVFIADTGNNRIRKVDAYGTITTYGGGATTVCSIAYDALGNGCAATQAIFSSPSGLATDNVGQVFVADTGNNVIRQINTRGWVSPLAGGSNQVCDGATDALGDGCSAAQTAFSGPTALAFDFTGKSLFVADTGNSIVRRIALTNVINATSPTTYTVLIDPVTRVAGNGTVGSTVDNNSTATLSQLNRPTGVAVDAASNAYIADTGNHAVRLVNSKTGTISTIAGILTASGTGTLGTAISTQFNAPGAIAVSANGALTILDSGNNRVVTDSRAQITFPFGRVNVGVSSPVQALTEINIGNTAAALASPLFTQTGSTGQFTLTPAANGNSSVPACATSPSTTTNGVTTYTPDFASGAMCNLNAQFMPSGPGNYSTTYNESSPGAAGGSPSITLTGTGAVLTPTSSTISQTAPAGNSQYGGSATFTVQVKPATCNTDAPGCNPTGTVVFIVDGTASAPVPLDINATASETVTGLSVGNHTLSCNYSGDAFYAPSVCPNTIITVVKASTTSSLAVTNNNQTQFNNCTTLTFPGAGGTYSDIVCGLSNLTATVASAAPGISGTVTFYVNGNALGTTSVNSSGQAVFTMAEYLDPASLNLDTLHYANPNNTLVPGTYTLTCSYSGSANFAPSQCAGVQFTVLPQPQMLQLLPVGCNTLYLTTNRGGDPTYNESTLCNILNPQTSGQPVQVSTAQGSTTDVTIFIYANNTVSGTFSFSCSGLPAASACTFSPTSRALTASTGPLVPIPFDVTLWTDLQPGEATNTSALHKPVFSSRGKGPMLALVFGWPLALAGLFGMVRLRRKGAARGLSLLMLALMMVGSSLFFTGCGAGGPGAYKPVLTPAGTYPITITVKSSNLTQTLVVNFKVTSPGIAGQE